MPRTLDPILEAALDSGAYEAVFEADIYSGVDLNFSFPITGFKLTGIDLEVTGYREGGFSGDETEIILKRGVKIDGVNYTLNTSKYFIRYMSSDRRTELNIKATLLPEKTVTLNGNDTYENVINAFCQAIGRDYELKDPSAAYWQYIFLPTGKQVILNDAMRFLPLLKQKYLIKAHDAGNGVIRFYKLENNSTAEITLSVENTAIKFINDQALTYRQFLWKDENQTVHYSTNFVDSPLHNLGYIESTANPPLSNPMGGSSTDIVTPVVLTHTESDQISLQTLSLGTIGFFEIIETLDLKNNPPWTNNYKRERIFSNTEGGAVPSTIERVSNYTPLNTSTFNNNLDTTINNLQALAEAVDDLNLGGTAPATTAANDFQVGDGAGSWITKTLAQAKTILDIFADAASDSIYYVRRNAAWTNLKTYTDTLYQAIGSYITDAASDNVYYGRRNAGWTNLKTYFDTLYAALSHTHAAADVVSGTIDAARLGSLPVYNGRLSVTVASNNLTVALKGMNGSDPSATNPVYIRIGDTIRTITAALSVTKNAGTNWFNSGGSELATKEIDYFCYLGYNATDGVVIGFSRIPYGNIYSDFSTTTTNEKYAGISTITNAAAGDTYVNVGRFAATLSAGAGYTWTVPTYTTTNLVQGLCFVTRKLAWTPTVTAQAGTPTSTTNLCYYKLNYDEITYNPDITVNNKGTASSSMILTTPMNAAITSGGAGREIAATGKSLSTNIYQPLASIFINFYDATTVWVNGYEVNATIKGFLT